jgi:hypothetical protein
LKLSASKTQPSQSRGTLGLIVKKDIDKFEVKKIKNIYMSGQHHYKATIKWTGNKGTGTDNYKNYERNHQIIIENKSDILGSSDPTFRGDKTKHNPEDLLVSS